MTITDQAETGAAAPMIEKEPGSTAPTMQLIMVTLRAMDGRDEEVHHMRRSGSLSRREYTMSRSDGICIPLVAIHPLLVTVTIEQPIGLNSEKYCGICFMPLIIFLVVVKCGKKAQKASGHFHLKHL